VSRSIVKEVVINAPADVVWRALTEAEELQRWFPVDARVEPGLGGAVWLSWGEGVEGTAPITSWEPERRFGWTETRGPLKLAVDFHIEARGGSTVVRLVHSGFGEGSEWDDEFHMTQGGWAYFMEHLRWYLERHRGMRRDVISFRDAVALTKPDALARLTVALGLGDLAWIRTARRGQTFATQTAHGERISGELVAVSGTTGQLGLTLEDLNDAMLFLEMESAQSGIRAGFWLSTYGLPPDQLAGAKTRFSQLYRAALAL
jgi:uncharacterized protein YndB with AHSA1/START domain